MGGVQSIFPQKASGAPGGITFSSQSGSGSSSRFPGHWVSPATCCLGSAYPQVWLEGTRALCAAAQASHAHRYAWGAPRFCVLGGSPSGPVTLPFRPMLPFSPMAPQLSGLSACSLCCPVSQRLSLLTLQDSSL